MLHALREALREIQAEKQHLTKLRRELRKLTPAMRANGHSEQASEFDEEIRNSVIELRAQLQAIADMGILVKDIDQGLVDFPAHLDGRIVFLCWMISEPDIAYWHDLDSGYDGRQPL